MLNEPTMEKLYTMRLAAMAAAWQQQQGDARAAELAFDDRFTLLVEAEHIARDNRRLSRLLKQAQLRIPDACVEDVEAGGARGLDKATVRQLATCSWVRERLNVLISGATGVGKSYVACALGHMACRQGLKVLYRRVPRLFDEMSLAKAEGSYARTLARIAKHELLILDDIGIGQITEAQRHDLLSSSTTATTTPRPSSPASSRSRSGTPGSETRPSPMPSSTASCTMPTSSR